MTDNTDITIQMLSKAAFVRGLILNNAIYIERIIDDFISSYFCGNDTEKRSDLMESIVSEFLNFDLKRQVFDFIISRKFSHFVTENPNFSTDIVRIMKDRNILAHWLLDTSKEGVECYKKQELRFVRFKVKSKNSSNFKSYFQTDIDNLTRISSELILALVNLTTTIDPSNSASGAASEPSSGL